MRSTIARRSVLGAFLLGAIALWVPPSRAACLRYEPQRTTIDGVLEKSIAYGAPGFGENRDDPRFTVAILKLRSPICVKGNRGDDIDIDESAVSEIGILYSGAWKPLVGRYVTVSGTLFHAITANHYRPIMMRADHLSPTSQK